MPRVIILTSLAMIACGTGSPSHLTESHRGAMVDSVEQMLDQYRASLNTEGFAAALAYYVDSPDFHIAENGRIAYAAYDSVAAALTALHNAKFATNLELHETRILPLAPGLAGVTASYQQTIRDSTGQEFLLDGVFSMTVVHMSEGWKFLAGHTSQPRQ